MQNAVKGTLALCIGAAFLVTASLAGAQELKGPGAATFVLKDGTRLSAQPRSVDITCGSGDTDSYDINDFGTTIPSLGPVVYVIVVATASLFGGPFGGLPTLDPIVDITTQGGSFIASNDDNGVGPNTIAVTGLDVLGGFLPIAGLDSFVFFSATSPSRITVRGFGGSCGPYLLYIL